MNQNQNPIAQNVRRLREAHHWTQEELAAASGVDVRTVQRAEAGLPLAVESLRAIAAVFDTTPDALSVSVEDFTRSLAEFEAKYALIDLKPISSGAAASDFLGGNHAYQLQRIGDFSDAQADAVAEFEQDLKDWGDLWSTLEPLQRRDAERSLDHQLESLRTLDLVVSMGQSLMNLTLPSDDASMRWQVLYCAVVPGKTPLRYLAREKGVPVSLV